MLGVQPPLTCRLGLHDWPHTHARGADGVECMRCGKQRRSLLPAWLKWW
jgi:hypothetical protein